MTTFYYSVLVMFGSGLLAIALATPVAIALHCYRPAGAGAARSLLTAFLFVPLYVIAGAWNAGFGSVGWWTLTQVSAAKEPLHGVFAVIWIHGTGAFAFAVWLLGMGLSRIPLKQEELARVSGNSWSLWKYAWLPALARWSLLGWLITAALVGSDMLVTNLYRIPTLTEECYLSVQSGEDSIPLMVKALVPSLMIACAIGWIASRQKNLAWETPTPRSLLANHGLTQNLLATLVLWGVMAALFLLPLSNLVLKAGWDPNWGSEKIERRWSFGKFIESLQMVNELGEKLYWSSLLGVFAATLAVGLSFLLVIAIPWGREGKGRGLQAIGIAVAFFCLSLPGPLINLIVKRSCESLPSPLDDWLLERTLGAPILALQFRCISIGWFCWLIAWHSWFQKYGEISQLSGRLSTWREYAIANRRIGLLAWFLTFSYAVSDLASYLLVLPPGVRTVSLWIFEQLHYGVRYKEAGICLLLMIGGLIAGYLSRYLFQSDGKTRYT